MGFGRNHLKGEVIPFFPWPEGEPALPYATDFSHWGVAFSFNRYRPINERHSWSLTCLVSADRNNGRSTEFTYPSGYPTEQVRTSTDIESGKVGAGHAVDLFPRIWTERMSRLRLETGATVTLFHQLTEQDHWAVSDTLWYYEVHTGLVFRNPWWIVRATLGYRSEPRSL